MYPHSPLWHYLWIAPHLLLFGIAGLMVRRGLAREFPVFLTYAIFRAVAGLVLFALDHASSISGVWYWRVDGASLALNVVLRFAVIYEIFSNVFRPYPALAKLGTMVLRWGGVVLLLIGIAVAAYAPGAGIGRITSGFNLVDRTVSLVQSGLLVCLFLFSSYFGLSWRSFVFGIAAGLGIFSSVDLATAAIRVQTGPVPSDYLLDFVTMVTYHCCVLIWLGYLLAPEMARRSLKPLPENNLEQWNTELQRLLLR